MVPGSFIFMLLVGFSIVAGSLVAAAGRFGRSFARTGLVSGAACEEEGGAAGGGGGGVRLSWTAHDQFKRSFASPGTYAVYDGEGAAVAAASFEFEPFWRPTRLRVTVPRGAGRFVVTVNNSWGESRTKTVTCDSWREGTDGGVPYRGTGGARVVPLHVTAPVVPAQQAR